MPEPLLDTSILIDLLRDRGGAGEFIGTRLRSGRLLLHAAVAAELITGARNNSEQRQLDRLFSFMRMVYPTSNDWDLALQQQRRLRNFSGTDWVDCLISATALRLDIPVATLNERHFKPFSKLKVVRPY